MKQLCVEVKWVLLRDLNTALDAKKKAEENAKKFEQEKMEMELHLVDILQKQDEKAEADKEKMKKVDKYIRDKENSLHYALAAFVILLGVVIALLGWTRCKQ